MEPTFVKATPESVGILSENVLGFLDQVEKEGVFFHSFALLKGDRVFAEGYRPPFGPETLHRMYSVSKTFTSMAVGLLEADGLLRLSDPVIRFFPEHDSEELHPYIRETTVRDLLMMATPFSVPTYCARMPAYEEPDWVWTFFHAEKPSHPAGTIFNYDTAGTYLLDAIVERLTGRDFLTFLKERALYKTGFSPESWCVKAPEGYAWGGSGVECTLMDLARFARLVMNKGNWRGEQLLPADYVRAAVSRQIDNCQNGFVEPGHGTRGYGYQIWVTADSTFSFLGMGTQLAICMPEEDLLFVCTADTQGNENAYATVFRALWQRIKEPCRKESLPENGEAQQRLQTRLSSLKYPVVQGAKTSAAAGCINGRFYALQDNPMGITRLAVKLSEDEGVLCWENAQGYKELPFGIGKTVISTFPQDGYFGDTIGRPGDHRYRCIGSGAWTEEHKLRLKVDLIDDYFGNLTIHLGYKGDELGVYMQKHAEFFLDEYQGFAGGKVE